MGFLAGFFFGGVVFLLVGWFLLPTPAPIQKWWEGKGWTDRVK